MPRKFEGPMEKEGRQLKELTKGIIGYKNRQEHLTNLKQADLTADNLAFNNMQEITAEAPDKMFKDDRVFTESPYNTTFNIRERHRADSRSFDILHQLFEKDKAESPNIKNWDFGRYVENLSSSRLEELFTKNQKGDPDFYRKGGDLLMNAYSDDADQLKLSAYNFYNTTGKSSNRADRSNISVKAPGY